MVLFLIGSSTTSLYSPPKSTCVRSLPATPSGSWSSHRRSSGLPIRTSSARPRNSSGSSLCTTNTKNRTRGVYRGRDYGGIKARHHDYQEWYHIGVLCHNVVDVHCVRAWKGTCGISKHQQRLCQPFDGRPFWSLSLPIFKHQPQCRYLSKRWQPVRCGYFWWMWLECWCGVTSIDNTDSIAGILTATLYHNLAIHSGRLRLSGGCDLTSLSLESLLLWHFKTIVHHSWSLLNAQQFEIMFFGKFDKWYIITLKYGLAFCISNVPVRLN